MTWRCMMRPRLVKPARKSARSLSCGSLLALLLSAGLIASCAPVAAVARTAPAAAAGALAAEGNARALLQQGGQAAASAPVPTSPALAVAAVNQVDYRRPLFVIPKNLTGSSGAESDNAAAGGVRISSPDRRANSHPTQFFQVRLGGATRDANPLRLFNITGARRCVNLLRAAELPVPQNVLQAAPGALSMCRVSRR